MKTITGKVISFLCVAVISLLLCACGGIDYSTDFTNETDVRSSMDLETAIKLETGVYKSDILEQSLNNSGGLVIDFGIESNDEYYRFHTYCHTYRFDETGRLWSVSYSSSNDYDDETTMTLISNLLNYKPSSSNKQDTYQTYLWYGTIDGKRCRIQVERYNILNNDQLVDIYFGETNKDTGEFMFYS